MKKSTKQKFRRGQTVRLPAMPDAGVEEEFGTIEEYEGRGMYIVTVDKKVDRYDDQIREVHEDGIRAHRVEPRRRELMKVYRRAERQSAKKRRGK